MMLNQTVRCGSEKWIFHKASACSDDEQAGKQRVFRNTFSAQQWLQGLQSNPMAIGAIRRFLAQSTSFVSLSGMADSAVIAQFATLLVTQRWHAHLGPAPVARAGTTAQSVLAAMQEAEPMQLPKAARSAPALPALPELDTFRMSLDLASMIAALENAALSGAPFCEECAKAAAAAAQAAAAQNAN